MRSLTTYYHDHRFRSRLEARWSCFFEALDIAFIYEREGYDLEIACYLPDFGLPEMRESGVWLEVKPYFPLAENQTESQPKSLSHQRHTPSHSSACTSACTNNPEISPSLTVEALAAALLRLPAADRARLATILAAGQGEEKVRGEPKPACLHKTRQRAANVTKRPSA
jgi:hypothetical protein